MNGSNLSLLWGVPFLGILLSLSTFPLFLKAFWHRHYGKVIFFWTLCFLVPALQYDFTGTTHEIAHVTIREYIPFIALIGSLFVVTSGIRVKSTWVGRPAGNASILFVGTVMASLIGTTGASMVMINPLVQANAWRKNKAHIFIFFIFLVSNIGGALSPMGDAPLFLGFIEGVPFLWPLKSLIAPTAVSTAYLIAVFFIIDSLRFKKEAPHTFPPKVKSRFKVNGKINIIFLFLIISVLVGTTLLQTEMHIEVLGTKWLIENILRDSGLIVITFLSAKMTRKGLRLYNHFSWEPLIEVAKVFAGIFVTMIPLLAILKAGEMGALGSIISRVNSNGIPNNLMYFWTTGLFSSFLDNAPSYLIFFHMAGGSVPALTSSLNQTLMAISMGAVFMGAMTYIGNAPNFMVRSIAIKQRVEMPSFFSYIVLSVIILGPIFAFVSFIFLK